MNSSAEEIVRVEDIHKQIDPGLGNKVKKILRGVSFRVHRGEIFGVVGPNGAGKTTTLKILMGLLRPDKGRASILGHESSEVEFRRQIGFLPEQPYFYEFLTGREILNFYAKLASYPRRQRAERVEMLLDWVGLSHAGTTRLRGYSKGMLQRIGIAQALIHDPSVVFLDEPMSGLDPMGRKDVRDLILRLRDEGKSVLFNSHVLSDVETICDRVAIIADGRVRYEGPVEGCIERGAAQTDIVLSNVSSQLGSQLSDQFGSDLRGFGEQLELRVPEKQAHDVLSKALADGAHVVSLAPYHESLESIFISTLGGNKS